MSYAGTAEGLVIPEIPKWVIPTFLLAVILGGLKILSDSVDSADYWYWCEECEEYCAFIIDYHGCECGFYEEGNCGCDGCTDVDLKKLAGIRNF